MACVRLGSWRERTPPRRTLLRRRSPPPPRHHNATPSANSGRHQGRANASTAKSLLPTRHGAIARFAAGTTPAGQGTLLRNHPSPPQSRLPAPSRERGAAASHAAARRDAELGTWPAPFQLTHRASVCLGARETDEGAHVEASGGAAGGGAPIAGPVTVQMDGIGIIGTASSAWAAWAAARAIVRSRRDSAERPTQCPVSGAACGRAGDAGSALGPVRLG